MGLWHDLRFAVRLLVKDKWFTLVAAIALALGIGVNTTVFTFVNGILFRGLPFDEPDRIMSVSSYDPVRRQELSVSHLDYQDWRAATRSFTTLAAFVPGTMNVGDEGQPPERFFGAFVSGHALKLIGERPLIGRDFLPEDDRPGAPPVAILSHNVWKNRYSGDPEVIGRTIRVNHVPSVVVGVMPTGFGFPNNTALWQPLALLPDLESQTRGVRGLEVFGRLAPGVTRAQAQAELAAIGAGLSRDHPDTNTNIQPNVQTYNERLATAAAVLLFRALFGAVAFVLLIACANVANLLLARSAHRSGEIAIRVALGATRWRIVRQLLVESLLLALVGGILGLAVSAVGIRLIDAATQDVGKPYWMHFAMDGSVFAFVAAICLGTGVTFGLVPALQLSGTDVNGVLKEGARSGAAGVRARRWTGAVIIGEVALTLVLLACAGFMIRSFFALYHLDLAIETSRLLTMRVVLPERKYPGTDQRTAFYQQLEERLRSNGQIQAASIASNLPFQGGSIRRLAVDGRPLPPGQPPPTVTAVMIDPRYFDTIGVSLVRGRVFTAQDGLDGREAVIVNQQFAKLHYGRDDPIGKRVQLTADPETPGANPDAAAVAWHTIVGLAPNVRQRNMNDRDPDPVAYLPFRSDPPRLMMLLARGEGDVGALTPLLREEVRAIDSDLPVFAIRTLDQNLARLRWPFRVFSAMFAIFAAIALLLSAIGLYAVTAYSVTQRMQEIGVRMALGAEPKQVVRMFLRRAFFQVGLGLTIGIAGALALGTVLESLLVQTSGRDPVTLLSTAAILAAVGLAASLWPARRATQLDPVVALRAK